MGKMKIQAKHCRRIGENLTGQDKFKRILARHSYPPGIHGPKGTPRLSEYGIQLKEKQKARYMYGLREKQFSNYYKKAAAASINTEEELLRLLERRLDNTVYRLRIATTRAQARQLVNHGHILVNNKRMNIPSYLVNRGDKIMLHEKSQKYDLINTNLARQLEVPNWMDFDSSKKEGTIINLPHGDDLQLGIDSRLIIEYYSK